MHILPPKNVAYTHDKEDTKITTVLFVSVLRVTICIIITFIDGIGIVEFSLWVNHLIGGIYNYVLYMYI